MLEKHKYDDHSKKKFKKWLNSKNISSIDGCVEPDECYINQEMKHIIIIEKKISTSWRFSL